MKDITPPNNRRSIRNVISPRLEQDDKEVRVNVKEEDRDKIHDFKVRHKNMSDTHYEKDAPEKVFSSKTYSPGKGRNRWVWWGGGLALALGVILILGFGISSQFATAEVVIEPIDAKAEGIQKTITVHKNPSGEELGFEIITVALREPRQVSTPASGEEYVEEKASGVIEVYNEFSTSQQVLVKNTRFESPDGLIYRINESLTIPGMTGEEPGVAQARVYADEPGEKYNIAPTTFTIPGFKGSPQFEKFHARSESSMQGGRVGNVPVINEGDLEGAGEELREGLEEELTSEAKSLIPDGFILFDGTYSIEENREIKVEEGNATLILNALLHGVLLKEDMLAQYLYKEIFQNDHRVEVNNWDNASLIILDEENDLKDKVELDLSISGDIRFFRVIDEEALASELAGVSIRDTSKINDILDEDNHPIFKAEVSVSPFWMPSFPGNPEKIKINIRY
jgi:hypothetical protein